VEIILLTLICFVALTAIVAAVGMVLRDLVFAPQQSASPLAARMSNPLVLRRLPLARNDVPAEGLTGSIDHHFGRVVIESGWDCTPIAASLFLLCCGLVAGGVLFLTTDNLLIAAIGMLFGSIFALAMVIVYRAKRMKAIGEQLPEVVDLLARAVRAGESLDQAIKLVGEKAGRPLAIEFRRCAGQLEMGLSVSVAMRALAHRIQTLDMKILTNTLSVHQQTGGELVTTLDRLAVVLRDRLAYRRQLRATTAAGRFSALLVASIGPLLFGYMFLFQPQYASKLVSLPIGQVLLGIAVALEIIGLAWISRLLKPEI
jgi:tight adherence protein B